MNWRLPTKGLPAAVVHPRQTLSAFCILTSHVPWKANRVHKHPEPLGARTRLWDGRATQDGQSLTEHREFVPTVTNPKYASQSDLAPNAAIKDRAEVLRSLGTAPAGLTEEEAAARLEQYGPNQVGREKHEGWPQRLYIAARNPLVILLTILATLSFATGDFRAGGVMLLMVVLGVSLRFVQETKANTAAAKLKAMISVTATVVRDGQPKEIALQHLVPGDVVKLSAGDMVPGDVLLLSAKDLFLIQATLTGESMPVEKTDAADVRGNVSTIERSNMCFLGTSVESGSATAVIVATGAQTYFGKVARSLAGQQVQTAFRSEEH